MDHRQLLRLLASGRVVVGGALLAAPGLAGRSWVGDAAATPSTKIFARALGIRDAALGVATIEGLDHGRPVRTLTLLGVACDAVDFAATAVAARHIGLRRALPVMAVAGTAAAVGLVCAGEVDEAVD
ncbi:MAG: hypothetical protein JJU45_18590 [Acidimicrobiia bacterium]|nr:hypothetical protein [Acidimicrobiia bacterium]